MKQLGSAYWLVLIGIIAVALSQPLMLLLVWHFHIAPNQVMGTVDLGAIMGAVFTAGGLIVAIVSVYTMVNVETVTKNAIDAVLAQLPKQIDARIRHFLEAFEKYQQAQNLVERYGFELLGEIEDNITAALNLEPTLTGPRSWLGHTYYQAAGLMYLRKRTPGDVTYAPLQGALRLPRMDLSALTNKAAQWLTSAARHNDGSSAEVFAELAQVYGMMGGRCADAVTLVAKANAESTRLPREAPSLLFLFGCCQSENDVKELGGVLGLRAPLTADDIVALAEKYYAERESIANPLYLIVVPRPGLGFDDPHTAGIVTIYDLQVPAVTAAAQWVTAAQTPGTVIRKSGIPQLTYDEHGAQQPQAHLPLRELAVKLNERFFVVAQFRWERFP